jgi:hypothetical protein
MPGVLWVAMRETTLGVKLAVGCRSGELEAFCARNNGERGSLPLAYNRCVDGGSRRGGVEVSSGSVMRQ